MKEFLNFRILHQRLWQWLSDHPEKNIIDWPEWIVSGGWTPKVLNFSFACEATRLNGFFNRENNVLYCCKCPVQWDCDTIGCDEYKEIFNILRRKQMGRLRIYHHGDLKSISRTAKKIANLKWVGKDQFFRDELTELPSIVRLSTDPLPMAALRTLENKGSSNE